LFSVVSEPLTAIYLAAGEGRRLRPLTDTLPKAMLEVGGKTLAERSLSALRAAGVPRIVAVTGHCADSFAPLDDLIDELRQNPRYDSANNVYSLWCTKDVVARGCYIVNSDVLFETAVAERLAAAKTSCVLCASDHGVDRESMKVVVGNGRVRTLSKSVANESNSEYIGLTRIDPAHGPRLAEILQAFVDRGETDVYYEDALNVLAAEAPVGTVDVDGLAWIEIDDHGDLRQARERIVERVG
jgi:choline kinase